MPRIATMNIGAAAMCARIHGTITGRRQALHFTGLLGPSDCFCQNEKLLRSHHGHSYTDALPDFADRFQHGLDRHSTGRWARLDPLSRASHATNAILSYAPTRA